MNYAAVVREIHNRLRFHANEGGMLSGLKIFRSGKYRIEGDADLPQVSLIDLESKDTRGTGTGTLTMWLRTARRHDWFAEEGDDPQSQKERGLLDWMLLVMDAVEKMPSDPEAPDQLLVMHDVHGAIVPGLNEPRVELLREPFTWETRMDEISELAFTMQLNISFSIVTTKRARRRVTPQVLPVAARRA